MPREKNPEDAVPHGVRLGGLCEEGLKVMLHQRVERRLAGPVDSRPEME